MTNRNNLTKLVSHPIPTDITLSELKKTIALVEAESANFVETIFGPPFLEVEAFSDGYDGCTAEVNLSYYRYETPEDTAEREDQERKWRDEMEEREREVFERLKAKFEKET